MRNTWLIDPPNMIDTSAHDPVDAEHDHPARGKVRNLSAASTYINSDTNAQQTEKCFIDTSSQTLMYVVNDIYYCRIWMGMDSSTFSWPPCQAQPHTSATMFTGTWQRFSFGKPTSITAAEGSVVGDPIKALFGLAKELVFGGCLKDKPNVLSSNHKHSQPGSIESPKVWANSNP